MTVTSHELRADAIRLAYGDRVVVPDLSLTVPTGAVTCIVGANACGKSTLLRALGRLLRPQAGVVVLDGVDLARQPAKALARTLGLLPQSPLAPDGITVTDLVSRGRYPHQSWLRQWSREDETAVVEALRVTGTAALAARPVDELSGGQRQRVWIALALAQQTDVLLLDEPTTYLDLAHQIEVLDLLLDLNRTGGRTVVIVLHDLNQAARYADHLVAMKDGRIHAQGPPAEVLDADLVEAVFGLPCRVVPDPIAGTPMVVPAGRHHPVAGVLR